MARVSQGDHAVLPATHNEERTITAFTPQPHGVTAVWLVPVLIAPTHKGMARLS